MTNKELDALKHNHSYDQGWDDYTNQRVSNPYSRGSGDWILYENGVEDARGWSSRFESDRTGYGEV